MLSPVPRIRDLYADDNRLLIDAFHGIQVCGRGANDEARHLQDTLRVLAAETETFSSNIYIVSTARGRLREHKTPLTGCLSDLTKLITALADELAQAKSEIDIKNSFLVALE